MMVKCGIVCQRARETDREKEERIRVRLRGENILCRVRCLIDGKLIQSFLTFINSFCGYGEEARELPNVDV